MHKLLSFLFALCLCASVSAQSARKVLDATAARMTQSGCVKASFRATQFAGTTPENETTGTMTINGNKFQMQTPEAIVWYDGKTQWSMMRDGDEVNMTEPTAEEQAAMNPAALVNIYKSGYNYSMSENTLRGRAVYTVYLTAKNKKAAFSAIIVDVDKKTYDPLCFRACKDGDWLRLAIMDFKADQSAPEATFTFPARSYPNVEIIDLR